MTTRDPLSPQWEDCKLCGGDHWTKDHPTTRDTPEAHVHIPEYPSACEGCEHVYAALTERARLPWEVATHDTPEAERAAFKRAELHRAHWCAECVNGAVVAERARIAEAVRGARDDWMEPMGTEEPTYRRGKEAGIALMAAAVLAIIEPSDG